MRVVKRGVDRQGAPLVIAYVVTAGRERLGVWSLCTNYQAGRDVRTWRYIVDDVSQEEAERVFVRRTAPKRA